jgi:diguanylate cyclase (GGDEF)-like protein
MKISDYDRLKSKLSKDEVNELLNNLVAITKFCLRKYDQMAQIGENYFVILLPFTDLIRAQQACERLSRQLAVELLLCDGDASSPVAVSMGITDTPRVEEGVGAAIRRADKALQKAGQNEIITHSTGQ